MFDERNKILNPMQKLKIKNLGQYHSKCLAHVSQLMQNVETTFSCTNLEKLRQAQWLTTPSFTIFYKLDIHNTYYTYWLQQHLTS
jgi:hypothetical protein